MIPKKYRVDGGEPDDGITGGQGRTARQLRDGYVVFCGVLVGICGMVGFVLWLALR